MEEENKNVKVEDLDQFAGGEGKKRYDAKCTKCGSLVSGCGCFSYDEAFEKAASRGKYGCAYCGGKFCFTVVEI